MSRRRKPRDPQSVVIPYGKTKYNYQTTSQAWLVLNQRLPNPDRVLEKRGQTMAIYRELMSDAHLIATLESRESATMAYDWRIERGECPEFLYKAIKTWFFSIIERKMRVEDLSRDELTSNLLDVIYWGYQPAELTWDYFSGLWMPLEITPLPPDWFHFFIPSDGVPELRFISKKDMINGEPPPDEWTLICPRFKPTFDNPYGRGVATQCFWPIVFKRAGLEFWLNCLERFGTPWVKGTIKGPSAKSEDLTAFATDLKGLVQDAVIALSENKEVELLEQRSARQNNDGFKQMCDFMDSQISKRILGHTLSTDAGQKGSYAATAGALTVRDDIQDRDKRMVASIWDDIINMIFYRNGYAQAPRPRVIAFHENEVDDKRATRDEALSRAGVIFKKSYFVRAYRLQEDDLEDEIVNPSKLQVTGTKKERKGARKILDIKNQRRQANATG